ncbi:hypothetical protein D3C86_1995580 [compost metagenome]
MRAEGDRVLAETEFFQIGFFNHSFDVEHILLSGKIEFAVEAHGQVAVARAYQAIEILVLQIPFEPDVFVVVIAKTNTVHDRIHIRGSERKF